MTYIDFEVGRDVGIGSHGMAGRYVLGVRFARFEGKNRGGIVADRKFVGVGPRAGAELVFPFYEAWKFKFNLAGSAILGKRKVTSNQILNNVNFSKSKSAIVPNIDGYMGFEWGSDNENKIKLSIGYAFDAYFGITESSTNGKVNRIMHGPVLGLKLEF